MADTKISAMPAASALTGAELVPVIQGGVNVRTTVQDISDFNASYIEVAQTSGTVLLTATPQLLKPTTIIGTPTGVSYDPATGEFTFTQPGNYGLSIAVNALANSANQWVYWYAENNNGAGWVVNTNSGKAFALTNNQRSQVFAANFTRRLAGQKVRYWIYSNASNVDLQTTTLGATGAVVPAIRIQYSS